MESHLIRLGNVVILDQELRRELGANTEIGDVVVDARQVETHVYYRHRGCMILIMTYVNVIYYLC